MSENHSLLGLVGRGLAMGAADVVPGVSGGTIAFITGIYDRLLNALKSISPTTVKILFQQGFVAAWKAIDGTFLLCVFGGILLSVLSFAHVISFLLAVYPEMLWSFFFGLILVSGLHMMRQVSQWSLTSVVALIAGIILAYMVNVLTPGNLSPEPLTLFLAGSIAICAMILPGISGSFILLLFGLYSVVLEAVKNLDILTLVIFGSGCIAGLLTFSHLLSWLLNRHRNMALSFLTGLMIGALEKVWPWKETLQTRINSSGNEIPFLQQNVLPGHYESLTGQSAYLYESISLMLAAIGIVLIIEWVDGRKHQKNVAS